jgi:protein-tyrosine phosphatase
VAAGPVAVDRRLDWDGCCNVRDLGGLPAADGRVVRRGALVRADAVDRLSAAGWAALWAHGVRTVIDLRNDGERRPDLAERPDDLTTVELPLDGIEDREFWDRWRAGPAFGTPVYYRPHLDRFPQRSARVIAAVARARPGGVLIHCGIGRDRTGLVTILALALVGVAPEDIAADYALSSSGVRTLLTRLGEPDHVPEIEAYLEREGTSTDEIIVALLASLDIPAWMRAGGLGDGDVAALRERLLEPLVRPN